MSKEIEKAVKEYRLKRQREYQREYRQRRAAKRQEVTS